MNVEFKKEQIAQIALNVRKYGKMFVTTTGQMFLVERDAEEAVRVKNMIIDEPDDYIGILTLSSDDFSKEKLLSYGKDTNNFNKLFEKARIPRTKKANPETFEKKRETIVKHDEKETSEIEKALGLVDEKETTEKEATEKEAAEKVVNTKVLQPKK